MSVTTSVLSAKCELFPHAMLPPASFTPTLPTLVKTNSFMLRLSIPSSTYVEKLRDGTGAAPAATTQPSTTPMTTTPRHLRLSFMTNPPPGQHGHPEFIRTMAPQRLS
jgi:hypothetical protein